MKSYSIHLTKHASMYLRWFRLACSEASYFDHKILFKTLHAPCATRQGEINASPRVLQTHDAKHKALYHTIPLRLTRVYGSYNKQPWYLARSRQTFAPTQKTFSFLTQGPRLSCSTSRVVAKMTKSVVARTCLRRFKLLIPLSSYLPHNSTGMQEHHHSQHVRHARNQSVEDPDARKNVPCSYTSASRVQAGNIVEDRTRPGRSPFPVGIRVGTASTTLDIYNEGPPSRAVAALMPPSAAPSPEGDCPISHKLSSIVNSCSGLSFLLVTCRWY